LIEVFSLLVVLVMSLIITRVATVALSLTGMTQESARFQARSALTGAGFTTNESERVVSHPVRRRIILALMLIGNTGLVLGASLMVMLLAGGQGPWLQRWEQIALLVGGLAALYVTAQSRWLERLMARGIERVLARHTDWARRDYASLLRLGGDYRVVEMTVQEGDWMAGQALARLDLPDEGVLVLGVTRRDGGYVGAPRGETVLEAGDLVMLYGRAPVLAELDERRADVGGHLAHAEQVAAARESRETETSESGQDGEGRPTDRAPDRPSAAGDGARDGGGRER